MNKNKCIYYGLYNTYRACSALNHTREAMLIDMKAKMIALHTKTMMINLYITVIKYHKSLWELVKCEHCVLPNICL